jgi:hypothetical protein
MKKCLWILCLLIAGMAWGHDFDRTAAVGDYFQLHNAGLAETPHSGSTARQFSWVRKVNAFDRDGWKCVVCGATNNLEMDHAVALMNGGSNDITNTFALCHSCHVEKTRMDWSLKKHRTQLARTLDTAP